MSRSLLIKRLKEGAMLTLFAEGSRTDTGDLLPIEAGAALVIRRAGVLAVPCVVQGAYKAWPKSRKIFRAHPVAVMFGSPLQTDGLKADEITQLIDRTFREMIAELRRIDRRIR